MTTKVKAQISMDDRIVKDEELEKILEGRQELKQSVSDYHKADKKAKDKIAKITTEMPYRVGRFIIGKQHIEPKSVAFETGETNRITIKPVDE